MELKKNIVARLPMPYPLGIFMCEGEKCVVAATEDHGPVLLARPPYHAAVEMVPGPGGCMALVTDSGRPDELFAIMGCFLGYKFQTGGVYRISRRIEKDPEGPQWAASKIIDLPFAHRIEFIDRAGTKYLIAATLAQDKSDPADWSKPGALFAARPAREDAWDLTPIFEGIHRNHGFLVTRFMGRRSLLVSGTEGLFAADLETAGADWAFRQVLSGEISEIAVSDFDGDGVVELAAIEPFHGNRLRIYKPAFGEMRIAWEAELAYGHCLLAGTFNGVKSLLVSNRAGSRDLVLYRFEQPPVRDAGRISEPTRVVVDSGVGAANMLVLSHGGMDRIFSTNQAQGEIASYSGG